MKEIPLTQGLTALVDDADWERVRHVKWKAQVEDHTAYAVNTKLGRLHRYLLNPSPDQLVDHRNGNGLDNRRSNLRLVDGHQNQGNRRKHRATASRYKGVTWRANRRRWLAFIEQQGRQKHLGCFETEVEAARAYDRAALAYWGREYAVLNFPVE